MKLTIPFEFLGEDFEIDLLIEHTLFDEIIEIGAIEIADVRYYIHGKQQEICRSLNYLVGSFVSKFLSNPLISDRTNEEIAKMIWEEL